VNLAKLVSLFPDFEKFESGATLVTYVGLSVLWCEAAKLLNCN